MKCSSLHKPAFYFSFLFLSFCACSKKPPRQVSPAFYHWRTELRLTRAERNYLDSLGAATLYVKFFDVDWDEAGKQPVPLAELQIDTANLGGLEIVPTVFITNRTLLNLPAQEVSLLAERILAKTTELALPLSTSHPSVLASFQFDCDWTTNTKDKYFLLINHFRKIAAKAQLNLSATIRLHQLKYFEKTGVPPVGRGMLMCYNMGKLESWQTENSILDAGIARQYFPISKIVYPLPLDLALPLFRWGVLFRDGDIVKLIHGLKEEDLRDSTRFAPIAAHRFQVKKNTYLQGHYLYEGDLLRLENTGLKQLEEVTSIITKVWNQPDLTLAFYHLDSSILQSFSPDKLKKILEKF